MIISRASIGTTILIIVALVSLFKATCGDTTVQEKEWREIKEANFRITGDKDLLKPERNILDIVLWICFVIAIFILPRGLILIGGTEDFD